MSSKTLAGLIERAAVEIVHGSADIAISSITEDSRQVEPGGLFIARPGGKLDGRAFIDDAIQRGAAAILSDASATVPRSVTFAASKDVALDTARVAEAFHDHPSADVKLIGVTGTNGKTTTAHLIHQLMNACGIRCGLIGTVQIDDGASTSPASLTTPSAIELSAMLARMIERGCKACAMEVSSHALHQKRVAGLAYDVAIFTNLTGDHLDYHGSMDEYAAAKAMLFEGLPAFAFAIVNADDPYWRRMAMRSCAKVIRCSLEDAAADCEALVQSEQISGADVHLRGPWGGIDLHLPLIGRHNVMNALQAAAAAHVLGATAAELADALENCTAPPGRLEPVAPPDHPFAVFVDYAHTDDALDNVLRAVKPLVPGGGRLRVVFGCGGDRDRTKRPRMARAAWNWADEVVITSDNPRTEDPDAIIGEVFAGVCADRLTRTMCIADRREAIRSAIARAEPGDIVLIAGKGHEDYQIIGTEERPFDDRLVATEAIRDASRRVSKEAAEKLTERIRT